MDTSIQAHAVAFAVNQQAKSRHIGKFRATKILVFCGLLLAFAGNHAHAQQDYYSTVGTDPRPRHLELLASTQVDQIDPRNGNLTIRHKDLVLPGNGGLDIVVWRTYNLNAASAGLGSTHNQSFKWSALGPGWSLGVAPRLIFDNQFELGTSYSYYSDAQLLRLCAGSSVGNFGYPPYIPKLELPDGSQHEFWHTGAYKGHSKNGWKIDCISSNVTATAPNGTVYNFGHINNDRYIGKYAISLSDSFFNGENSTVALPARSSAYMMAKTATDVNGNQLSFTYSMFGSTIPHWSIPGSHAGPDPGTSDPTNPANVESPSLRLMQVSSSDGRSVSFAYNASTGRLTTMTDHAGRVWSYTYLTPDANNSRVLSKVTLPTGLFWSYGYQPGVFQTSMFPNTISPLNNSTATSRKLISMQYPTGGLVTYQYDYYALAGSIGGLVDYARGERVKSRTLSTGHSWTYAYALGGAGAYDTTTETGPDGVTTYKFMGVGYNKTNATLSAAGYQNNAWRVGQLMEKTYPSGSKETYVWRQREIVASYTRIFSAGAVYDQKVWAPDLEQKTITRDGATYLTTFSNFDAYGNPGTMVESGPNGGARTTTFTYLNDTTKWIIGRIKDENSSGLAIARTFDANGNMLSFTQNGVTTSYTYDVQGNLSTKTLPRNIIYSYSDYKYGIPQTENQPEGVTIARIVDAVGNITSETNGEGKTTTYGYDALNRVTSVTHPIGNQRVIAYTATTKTTTRGGLVEDIVYSPFGHLLSINLGGVTTTFTHDAYGRKTFESNPDSSAGTTYAYDSHSRIKSITNADGTSQVITYGAGSKSIQDERGSVTTFTYRAYGSPEKLHLMSIAAPVSAANIVVTRNADDQIATISQGGLLRTYGYDAYGYLVSVTNPETGTTTYGRDIAGNMTSRSIGTSGLTTYTYDEQNRLITITYPGTTPGVTLVYSKTGKQRTVLSALAVRANTYDDNDNLVGESLAVDGTTLAAHYTYNGNDQLASMTYPYTGHVVDFAPDVLGRPTIASGYATAVTYWPSGQLKKINYANGTISNYGQNSRLWPSLFSTAIGSSFHNSVTYSYDGAGNLLALSDSIDATYNRVLNYDALNRLTSVDGPWGAGSITYNGVGNLQSQVLGSGGLYYTYDIQNRLASISGNRVGGFTYDVYGNVVADSFTAYVYDDVPNLRCVGCGTSNQIEYAYDGSNKRVSVTKNGAKTYEMYDARGHLLLEYTPSQSHRVIEYIYLGGRRIAQRELSQ